MGRERDPLSARYDSAAERFIGRAIEAKGAWVQTTLQPPSPKLAAWAMRRGIDVQRFAYVGSPKSGGAVETAAQTAFRRACYWDDRIYLWDKSVGGGGKNRPRNPHRSQALKFRWGRRTVRGRIALARVFPVRSASSWAAKNRPHHH